MFTPLITNDSDGTALAAPVDAARRNGATYKTRTIDDLRIKDDRLHAAIEGTGHLLFDGGMGTMLQAAGMKAGALPELLNFEEPQVITDIQRQYVEAGCDVITANTFGANAHKLDGAATVAGVFAAAVACAREAGARYVAGDIGPIGALLRPLGTLSFDEAYDLFAEEVRAGVDAGVDLFIIETMTDLAEIKAAVLACRENSDLPVFATMTFEEDGRTFLGTSPEVAAITLDAIGADVLGINCSQGPAELRGLAARMLTVTDKPIMVQANAGLPHVDDDGNTVFDIQAPEYAEADAAMIVVTAGAAQKPGETRLDLVNKNVNIFKSIIPEIKKSGFDGILLIVSNPVDVLTYAAIKMSGLPEGHVIGSGTVLDTGRLQQMLGAHVEVDPRDVQAYVMGEHGDSEFVAWSSAQVAGVPLNTFCELHGHLEHEAAEKRIAEDVKNSAYTIIEKKHATYYGVAMAVKRICTAVMRDEQTVLPVSSLMVGEYGLSDLAISMPTVVGRDGVVCRVPVPLNDDEQHELTASAKALKDIIDSVDFSC